MLLNSLFVLLIPICHVYGSHFTFDASTLISTSDNWLHEEIPCVGDHIRFDTSQPVVAFMDHNVDVESIYLPNNGMIIFNDNGVDIGGDANWQCAKDNLEEAKDVFFTRGSRHDTSFYNPKNWVPEQKRFLHMNQIPSEFDDVIVSPISAAQMYLDTQVKVNTFKWYKREQMTTEDFNVLLRSMEGQFQINLARPWAHESDQGGVQRLIAEDAIIVKNKKIEADLGGVVNPNSDEKILNATCAYIQCQEPTQCIDSFKPFGHCCHICGTRIEIAALELNYNLANTEIFNVLNKMEPVATVFATFERKTMTWRNSEYEIVLISPTNTTFDEDFHRTAANKIIERLATTMQSNHRQAILNFNIHTSKIDRTIKLMSKVVACLIWFAVLVVFAGIFVYQNLEMRVTRNKILNPVITYRRRNDDVAIEMDGVGEGEGHVENIPITKESEVEEIPVITTQPTTHPVIEDDEVEDWRNINPNFDLASSEDVEAPMEFEMTETVAKPKSDELTEVEKEDSGVSNENFLDDFLESPKQQAESGGLTAEDGVGGQEDHLTMHHVPTLLDMEAEDIVENEQDTESPEVEVDSQEDYANPLFINPNFFEDQSDDLDEEQLKSDSEATTEPTQDSVESEDDKKEEPEKEPENDDGMDLVQF